MNTEKFSQEEGQNVEDHLTDAEQSLSKNREEMVNKGIRLGRIFEKDILGYKGSIGEHEVVFRMNQNSGIYEATIDRKKVSEANAEALFKKFSGSAADKINEDRIIKNEVEKWQSQGGERTILESNQKMSESETQEGDGLAQELLGL